MPSPAKPPESPAPPAESAAASHSRLSAETHGLLLGLVAVVIFAMSLPMTRLSVGHDSAPLMSPVFVTTARAALAGLLSVAYLLIVRARKPARQAWGGLAISGLGTVVAFPIFLAMALRYVDASHAGVMTGTIPLATAICGAIYFRQRPSIWFWVCALIGAGLVVSFAVGRSNASFGYGDWLVLAAIVSVAIAYIGGVQASAYIPSTQVICWALVVTLIPMSAIALYTWPQQSVGWQPWASVVYLGVFPMWLGFFAWYRAMVLGGAVRISQLQLLQPFLTLLFAMPIVGEPMNMRTVLYALSVIVVVYLGKKAPIR